VLRRRPLSLPHDDQTPLLAELARGGAVEAADPDRLVRAALYHGFAVDALGAAREGRLALPEGQRRTLADVAAIGVLRSAALRRELPAVAEAAGEPVLVKGPALADRYYPDPRLRPFVDLDLLVPPERLRDAAAALAPLGFEVREEFRPRFAEIHGHDVHMVKRIGSYEIGVELHWRIGDDPIGNGLDHELLLAEAERLNGVAVPGTSQQLLVVSLHLLSDRAKRLVWVRDVERVARSADEPDWERAFALAEELGLAWVLHRALDYAAEHLGLDRDRPRPAGPPPDWGPVRAVEELDMRASTHVGRLAALRWRERPAYLWSVLVPTRAGLRGTVGGDGAPTWRLAARHASKALAGLAPRRR
jgi:hypothetical protein